MQAHTHKRPPPANAAGQRMSMQRRTLSRVYMRQAKEKYAAHHSEGKERQEKVFARLRRQPCEYDIKERVSGWSLLERSPIHEGAWPVFTSSRLQQGEIYTREQLRQKFNITDQTLYTGIFKPIDHNSIWLFVTEHKSADMTEYNDFLDGDTLHWDGQTSGRKDQSIITHEQSGLELLVFYRKKKLEYPGAGFQYEGRFRYQAHTEGGPTHFTLQRLNT